jgi:hypothetical protein
MIPSLFFWYGSYPSVPKNAHSFPVVPNPSPPKGGIGLAIRTISGLAFAGNRFSLRVTLAFHKVRRGKGGARFDEALLWWGRDKDGK